MLQALTLVGLVPALDAVAARRVSSLVSFDRDRAQTLNLGYGMENEPDEFDLTWEIDDIKVVVDRKSALYLKDSTLDYSIKNLMEGGFVFSNPQSLRSCGCGTSFTAK